MSISRNLGRPRTRPTARPQARARGVSRTGGLAAPSPAADPASAFRRRVGNYRGRTPRLPPATPPVKLEESYNRDIRRLYATDIKRLESRIISLIGEDVEPVALDAVDPAGLEQILRILSGLRRQSMVPSAQVEKVVNKHAEDVLEFAKLDQQRRYRVIGAVDIVSEIPDPDMRRWIQENVLRIKRIENTHFDRLEKLVKNAVGTGIRAETLKRQITEATGATGWDAERIARDQIGKANGRVRRQRDAELGLGYYIWRNVGDNRVRREHEALEGRRFSYERGHPTEGHPGEPILCRCFEEPDFDALLTEL